MNELALVYLCNYRVKDAERPFLEVTEARKTILSADHCDILTSMHELAWEYVMLEWYKEASRYSSYEQSLLDIATP